METKKLYAILSIFLLLLLALLSSLAADYYVAVAPSGTGDCSSPANACELQTALDTAAGNGADDTIYLAVGTYDASYLAFTYLPTTPENRMLTLQGAGADSTTLDGGNANQILIIKTIGEDSNAHITIRCMSLQNGNSTMPSSGGGLLVKTSSADITIEDSEFTGNSADYAGGAHARSYSGTVTLTNNTFSLNFAEDYGGGANAGSYSVVVTLTNNTFSGNPARFGGGVYAYSNSGIVTFTNNTFSRNSAYANGGGVFAPLNKNTATANIYINIAWDNKAIDIYTIDDWDNDGTGATVNLYNNDYNDFYIQVGNNLSEENNINADPLFVYPENDDFHLKAGSPCIDKGEPTAPERPATDFEGDDRIIGAAPDIGVDEFALVTIEDILEDVENLIDRGVLNQGQGNALIAKLKTAEKMLNKGNTTAACNQLQAFINQVQA